MLLPLLALAAGLLGRAAVSAVNPSPVHPNITFSSSPFPSQAGGSRRLEIRWSPCSSHIFVAEKRGIVTAVSSVKDELPVSLNFSDPVYEFGDHGITGMLLHPNFPTQPFLYLFYTAQMPNGPNPDDCPLSSNFNGLPFCQSKARLARYQLSVKYAPGSTRCTQFALDGSPQVLIEDWCSSSKSHGIGNAEWYDGDMILHSGDLSQPGGTDYGYVGVDTCYDAAKKLPQGRLRSQREDFLSGKLILVKAASLLVNRGLVLGSDYDIVAKGFRNAYNSAVDPVNLDIYIGDVGSKIKEEINMIKRSEMLDRSLWPLNFGWPCLEGTRYTADPFDGDAAWLKNTCSTAKGEKCDLCKDVFPCAFGVKTAGCSSKFRPPSYEYRDEAIDKRYSTECRSATSAITALAFLDGSKFGASGAAAFPWNLVAADYGSGCMWTFGAIKNAQTGKYSVNFAGGAQLLLKNYDEPLFLTTGPDGYLYSAKANSLEVGTMWKFGLNTADGGGGGGGGGTGPPVAGMGVYLLDVSTQKYNAIDCTDLCTFAVGASIRFDAFLSEPGANPIATYLLNWGDGTGPTTKTTTIFTKNYLQGGTFSPTLTVTDTKGLADTYSVNMQVDGTGPVTLELSPASGTWKFGDTISFALVGADRYTAAQISYDGEISHCLNTCSGSTDCHIHTFVASTVATNKKSGSFVPESHELPSSSTLVATITPGTGSSFKVSATTTAMAYTAQLAATTDAGADGAGGIWRVGWPLRQVDVKECGAGACATNFMALSNAEVIARQYMSRGVTVYKFRGWNAKRASGVSAVTGDAGSTAASIKIDEPGMTLLADYSTISTKVDKVNAGPTVLTTTGYYGFIQVTWQPPAAAGGYDWVLVSVVGQDANLTDYSTAALISDRSTFVYLPKPARAYTVKLAGFNSVTATRSNYRTGVTLSTSGDPSQTCYEGSSPYDGAPAPIPGTIEFEDFDNGPPGTAYSDATPGNSGNGDYRPGSDVDIQAAGSNGFSIVDTRGSEFLLYTVNVKASKAYSLTFSLASATAGSKTLFVMLDRASCLVRAAVATVSVPGATGGTAVFQKFTLPSVTLPAGEHTLRVCFAGGGLVLDKLVAVAAV